MLNYNCAVVVDYNKDFIADRIQTADGKKYILTGSGDDPEMSSMRNVAGEHGRRAGLRIQMSRMSGKIIIPITINT